VQFVFEDYVLDLDRRELSRGSKPIATGPQVFDLLVYPCGTARVVSGTMCWMRWRPHRLRVDATSHVNAVRKAVGDSGEQRSRTIARKGLWFVGDVNKSIAG
jgi:DNA-binding winged helix-turn-helix (wHTH) protein